MIQLTRVTNFLKSHPTAILFMELPLMSNNCRSSLHPGDLLVWYVVQSEEGCLSVLKFQELFSLE